MRKLLLLSGSLLALGACADLVEGQLQPLTVVTPGAQNAMCVVYTDNIKYRVRPPDTIRINKSSEDLVVDCRAPGNRNQTVVIPAAVSGLTLAGNLPTGLVPGASYDYASGAMFQYPKIVSVDFTGMPVTPEDLPAHNNPDIRQPETYDLEEFLPSSPRLNADKYAIPIELRRRERQEVYSDPGFVYGDNNAAGKADLIKVINATPDQLNPAGVAVTSDVPAPVEGDGSDAGADPIPLYPGQ